MQIIAHRGASFEAPENTLAAFSKALDAKADGIELDVYPLEDEWIVFHDRYLERLTATPGRLLDLTLAQVRKLKIFGQQHVPTLSEALEHINGRCMVNIELKGGGIVRGLHQCIDHAIKHHGFSADQILISSFNHHWLQAVKHSHPEQRIGALVVGCPIDYCAFATRLDAYSVHVDVDFLTPEMVQDAHQRNLKIYVYTVDEAHDIEELHKLGVDGIFTNHPAFSRNILTGLPVSPSEPLLHY
ncbi:MAG: glycerophosphodiester phosphodiesterase family protein [Idiomarina sp.]